MVASKESRSGVVVRLVRRWPAAEILGLYRVAGWWDGSTPSHIDKIVSKSFAFAVAVEQKSGKAVGMGRVLSDGVSDAYIQDVIVLPAYRSRRIGEKIVAALRDRCLSKKVSWVALVAESGTEKFYRKLGFKAMKGHTPMKYGGSGK